MPDEIDRLLMLDARATHHVERVDVSRDVLNTLQSRRQMASDDLPRSLIIAAGASWVVAIALAIVLQQSLAAFQDPLRSLLSY